METDNSETNLQLEVASIKKIPIISTLLDVICRTTGMRFAAVARVTEKRWITCSVNDNINFGLQPGDELKIETTICSEIRQSNAAVIIDHVDENASFCNHPAPAMYGFKSYISVPIIRKDGTFFGTLCAIDPSPAKLNTPEIIGMFTLFSELISFHLQALDQIQAGKQKLIKEREIREKALEQKNAELLKMNAELESFAYVASHDLQEPLRKIQTFSNLIHERDYEALSENGKHYFSRMNRSVERMQTLIRDLIMYTQVKVFEQPFQHIELGGIIEEITQNYKEELQQKEGTIKVTTTCMAYVIPFQFNQLLQNLIGNSIKFSKTGVSPVIQIGCVIEKGNPAISNRLAAQKNYCHITLSDNGIGFEPQYKERIFNVFQRLNGREEYAGTGIGLTIVKKIVDNHHGVITAHGEVEKGARFDIYIPQPDMTA